jgi:hypothetical protein
MSTIIAINVACNKHDHADAELMALAIKLPILSSHHEKLMNQAIQIEDAAEYSAAVESLDAEVGDLYRSTLDRLAETRANTSDGLKAKLRAIVLLQGEPGLNSFVEWTIAADDLAKSIVLDLLALPLGTAAAGLSLRETSDVAA